MVAIASRWSRAVCRHGDRPRSSLEWQRTVFSDSRHGYSHHYLVVVCFSLVCGFVRLLVVCYTTTTAKLSSQTVHSVSNADIIPARSRSIVRLGAIYIFNNSVRDRRHVN